MGEMNKLFLVAFLSCLTASVFAQVSVTATAGTAGPTTYTNLSNAFAAVNAGTHQGAITISIVGNNLGQTLHKDAA
jgi:carbonic anhydrase